MLTVEFAKKNLFTYTEKKVVHVLHEELNLTDKDIEEFICSNQLFPYE